MAYRRRFLLEKYPHLADEEAPGSFPDAGPDGPDDADEAISVLGEIAKAGGPTSLNPGQFIPGSQVGSHRQPTQGDPKSTEAFDNRH